MHQNPLIPSSILLVVADANLAKDLSQDLTSSGFEPILAASPSECRAQLQQGQPALVVIGLAPELSLQLCQTLRQGGVRLPLILLLEQDRLEDRVACLTAGADDYWLKPYRREDFLQFLQLYLQNTPSPKPDQHLKFENLSLDLTTRQVQRRGRAIELTMKEYDLLKYLMEHPRETLNREQILENVWGEDFDGESNVIEVYIRYLRLKIEEEGEKRLIHTVRGIGYVLREG
jgi:two-component system, OmpR family, response regulator NblR